MQVSYEKSDDIVVITINRPEKRNAVDRHTAEMLFQSFSQFDNDPELNVAILTGAAGNFCAGADLKALADGDGNLVGIDGDGPMGPTRMRLLKPVIAAVEGYAVAGGMELALWADLRVASRTAVFGVFCRRFGVPLIDLGTIRLPRLIGQSRAMDLILTGRPVNADEAFLIGLANRLVEPGEALSEARTLARQIADYPQTCLRHDRRSVLEQWDLSYEDAMRNEVKLGLVTLSSGESLQGAKDFTQGQGRHGGNTN